MKTKSLLAPLATAAMLAGALLVPTGAFAHDHHHGGHHGGHHGYDRGWSHHGKQKHKHKRRVVHEHYYRPAYVPARPYYREGRHDRDYGGRNRVTITYSGGWD